jgi:hypothetical protein
VLQLGAAKTNTAIMAIIRQFITDIEVYDDLACLENEAAAKTFLFAVVIALHSGFRVPNNTITLIRHLVGADNLLCPAHNSV